MTSYQLWETIFPQEKRWLGLIITASLIMHLAVFFIFRIESLPEGRVPDRPASVVFISSDTGINRLDGSDPMKWIDWRDPAVIALPRAPIPKPLPLIVDQTASYQQQPLPELPTWNPLEVPQTDVASELNAVVQSSMKNTATAPMPLTVEAPPKLSGSVVVMQGALKNRKVVNRLELPRPQTKVSLTATEYYVRVLSGGAVVQVKVDRSSGSTEIDQEGANVLKKWQFEALEGETEDAWGRVIVFWDFQEENPDKVELRF